MGIMRCEQEEKCPESSQKPKKSKRNMKIQFKDRKEHYDPDGRS